MAQNNNCRHLTVRCIINNFLIFFHDSKLLHRSYQEELSGPVMNYCSVKRERIRRNLPQNPNYKKQFRDSRADGNTETEGSGALNKGDSSRIPVAQKVGIFSGYTTISICRIVLVRPIYRHLLVYLHAYSAHPHTRLNRSSLINGHPKIGVYYPNI